MSSNNPYEGEKQTLLSRVQQPTDRRSFLKWTGAGAAVLAIGACEDTDIVRPGNLPGASVMIDFSDPATAIMNYAYALEQLEAAYYTQVVANFASGLSADERSVLSDLRDHEVAHREFFKAKLGNQAIGALTPDFSAVNFSDRMSVLQTAQTFEDLGVWAYNGAAQFIPTSATNLIMAAGEIVSVEARHAAAIRDILDPLSFAPDAFDRALVPSVVLPMVRPFVQTEIIVTNLPANA